MSSLFFHEKPIRHEKYTHLQEAQNSPKIKRWSDNPTMRGKLFEKMVFFPFHRCPEKWIWLKYHLTSRNIILHGET